MAVKSPRRIGAPTGQSLYERVSAHVMHNAHARRGIDATERDHPDLVVERDGNLLSVDASGAGAGSAALLYGFENPRAFVKLFPDMLEELLPRLRRTLRIETVRFRLTYSPARPVVEPVLKRLWFTPSRDWLGFTVVRGVKLPGATVAGVKFRDATEDDLSAMVRIDREAFPRTPIPSDAMRELLRASTIDAIVATRGEDVAGFCLFDDLGDGGGYINILAVSEGQRGRGIGGALTVRATKRLFAAGAREVGLTTDEDNAPAIRLYVALGFKQTRGGRDYTRPTDPKRIESMRTEGEGTVIRFGGWR
jgi:ribosomal protein S18 acetylase RimI-like enzyme